MEKQPPPTKRSKSTKYGMTQLKKKKYFNRFGSIPLSDLYVEPAVYGGRGEPHLWGKWREKNPLPLRRRGSGNYRPANPPTWHSVTTQFPALLANANKENEPFAHA